jgi:hypothetical protein
LKLSRRTAAGRRAADLRLVSRQEDAQLQRAAQAFTQVRSCRFQMADRIKSDVKAGRVTRDAAEGTLRVQKQRFDEELAFAREIGLKLTERGDQLQFAKDELLRQDPAAREQYASLNTAAESGAPPKANARKHGKSGGRSSPRVQAQKVAAKPNSVVDAAAKSDSYTSKAKSFNSEVSTAATEAQTQFTI